MSEFFCPLKTEDMEKIPIENVINDMQVSDSLRKVFGINQTGNVALSLSSSLQSIPYKGDIPAGINANDLKTGLWYNLSDHLGGENFPFGYGFVIVRNFRDENTSFQIHFSTTSGLAIRVKWGGKWFVRTFAEK
jgi:hypothetical protein